MSTPAKNHFSDKTLSIALVIGAAFWGFYWLPLRTIEAGGMSGVWSVAFFNACPLILMLPVLLVTAKQLRGITGPTCFAAIFLGAAFTLYANGLVETTVIRATMLYYLTPVWSTMIGVIWLGEHLSKARILAIVMAFTGLFLLLSNGDATAQPLNIGDLYSLLSGISWAFGLATLKRWPKIPVAPLTTFTFIATTVLSVLFAFIYNSTLFPDTDVIIDALPTAMFWSIVVLLPCFFIIFTVSKVLFPGRVGILTMSEVVVAVISASILLPGETMIWIQWLGALAIVLAGLIEVGLGYTSSSTV